MTMMSSSEYATSLCRQLFALQQAGDFCDVSVTVGDATVQMHRAVIAASSRQLRNELDSCDAVASSKFDHLTALDVPTLSQFVRLVYTGEFATSDCDVAALMSCCREMGIRTSAAAESAAETSAGTDALRSTSAVHFYQGGGTAEKGTQVGGTDDDDGGRPATRNTVVKSEDSDDIEESLALDDSDGADDSFSEEPVVIAKTKPVSASSDGAYQSSETSDRVISTDQLLGSLMRQIKSVDDDAAAAAAGDDSRTDTVTVKRAGRKPGPRASGPVWYKCDRCRFSSDSPKLLLCHAHSKHGVSLTAQSQFPVYHCPVAGCAYCSLYERTVTMHHLNVHDGQSSSKRRGQLACDRCGRALQSRLALAMHMQTHARTDEREHADGGDPSTPTVRRSKRARTASVLLAEYTGGGGGGGGVVKRRNECHLCGRRFPQLDSLMSHIVDAHGKATSDDGMDEERGGQSDDEKGGEPGCTDPEERSDDAKRGQRSDDVKRSATPFTLLCSMCPYETVEPADLQIHEYQEHDAPLAPPIPGLNCCSMCRFVSMSRITLKKHQLRQHRSSCHSCPYDSTGCQYKTTDQQTLDNHVLIYHTDKDYKPLMCHLCGHTCKLKGNLAKHIRKMHSNPTTSWTEGLPSIRRQGGQGAQGGQGDPPPFTQPDTRTLQHFISEIQTELELPVAAPGDQPANR